MKSRKEKHRTIVEYWLHNDGYVTGLKRLRRVILLHAERCLIEGAPFSEALLAKAKNASWRELFDFTESLSQLKYDSARMYYLATQSHAYLKKYPFKPKDLGFNPRLKAERTFSRMENRCRRINKILRLSLSGRYGMGQRNIEIGKMRSFVAYVLGDLDLSNIYSLCDFGSGSSIGIHGDATHIGRKIESEWTVTALALPYALGAIRSNYQILDFYQRLDNNEKPIREKLLARLRMVPCNKIAFVPKTVKTDRSIAVEASLNTFVQKGIDSIMRLKLKRIGIDLSDQSRNAEMARDGSARHFEDDSFCTIDLSNASDTLSYECVKSVLPSDWFDLLNRTRSGCYSINGKLHTYHKFCSQGNGFCFPLQTLLFAAICHAVGAGSPNKDFRVYGDDIIVRKTHYEAVINLLRLFGFIPNKAKSFGSGPFRESCGRDWFGGEDVRPCSISFDLGIRRNMLKLHNLLLRSNMVSSSSIDLRTWLKGSHPVEVVLESFDSSQADRAFRIDSISESVSPHVVFSRKQQAFLWLELGDRPVMDRYFYLTTKGREVPCMMYAVLRGKCDKHHTTSEPIFTFRRKTRTHLTRKSGMGATSQWLPTDRY